jgi:polar amino acid transport system substrate-binding protein
MSLRRARSCLFLALALALAACSRQELVIESPDDAAHARIGVMTGSTGEALAREMYPEADVKSFDDIMDAVSAIKAQQLDAIMTTFPAALQVSKHNADLYLLPDRLSHEETAVAMRRDDPELLRAVDQVIASLEADGTLASMKQRWFKPDLSPYQEIDIPAVATGAPLRIAVSATREPMSFVDANGRITGHDGELARLIGYKLQRPVEFQNMKFLALIPALQSGKVDLIVTGMTATEERRRQVAFTRPYYSNAQVLLVRRAGAVPTVQPATAEPPVRGDAGPGTTGEPALRSLDDIADKRIAVLLGSVHETYARTHYAQARILQFQTLGDVILAVKTGKADVAFFDAGPLAELMRSDDSFATLGDPVFSFDMAPGFAKENAALRTEYNRFLAELRRSGAYDDMRQRWMDRRETVLPAVDAPAPAGKLVLGVSDVGLPYVAVVDNRLVGFDIELAQRFAAFLGRKLVVSNMDFGSLVAAVSSGKVDMISSAIFVTDERKQQVDFGDPYDRSGVQVFALKTRVASAGTTAYAAAGAASGAGGAARPQGFFAGVADSFEANIVREKRYLLILDGLRVTVIISIFATVLGTLLGALVCWLRMSHRPWLVLPAKAYINLIRGMPVLVLLMLIFYVVFASVDINPVVVAIIAFGLNFGAYVAEIFRTGIEGVDRGQTEAGLAMGFTRLQAFRLVVLPQTIQRILPVYKGEFISLVKMTSIVGYIAVQDLTKASDIIRSRTFDAFFPLIMVAVLYFLIAWGLMQALEYVERTTDPKRRRAARARP